MIIGHTIAYWNTTHISMAYALKLAARSALRSARRSLSVRRGTVAGTEPWAPSRALEWAIVDAGSYSDSWRMLLLQ